MKEDVEIHVGDRAPQDPTKNTEFHQVLIDLLLDQAKAWEWSGARFCQYHRQNGIVAIGIKHGSAWPGLEDLRAFRDTQMMAANVVGRPDYATQLPLLPQ